MFAKDFTKVIVKLVQTKTISAFGTVISGLTTLQILIEHQIHYNLMGTPTTIIGNTSNKQRAFCLAKIELKYIGLFPYIITKNDIHPLLVHKDDIPQELLTDTTDLKSFMDPIVVALVPNLFIIYYGKPPPMEISLTNNKVKAKMLCLGSRYDLWGRIVEETSSADKLSNLLIVVDEVNKNPELVKRFAASYNPDSPTKLASNNGPCSTITNVQSDNYHQAIALIKNSSSTFS